MQKDDFTLWEEELDEATGGANFVRSYLGIVEDIYAYLDPSEMADALAESGYEEGADMLRRGGGVMGLTIAELVSGCFTLGVMPVTLFVGPDMEGGAALVSAAVAAGRAARDSRESSGRDAKHTD